MDRMRVSSQIQETINNIVCPSLPRPLTFSVRPTPWRATSSAPATQITSAKLRRPSNLRAYIRPLGEHQVLRLPRKSHRHSCGDQATPGRTSDPLESTKYRACYANHTRQSCGDPGATQGVHPTPSRAPSTAPGHANHTVAKLRRPSDPRCVSLLVASTAPAWQFVGGQLRCVQLRPQVRTSDPVEWQLAGDNSWLTIGW